MTVTRQQLFSIEGDLMDIQDKRPGLAIMINTSVKRFLQRNTMQLKVNHSRLASIKDRFIQKDLEGNYKADVVNGKPEPLFITDPELLKLAGVPDVSLVEKYFNEEVDRLMQQQINIEI